MASLNMAMELRDIVAIGTLPVERLDVMASLLESDECYIQQEGPYWDFKRNWPFSYSDAYFGGIARLICAFANCSGGIIVFGVHDASRKAGQNSVSPNLDRLQSALDNLLTEHVEITLRRYDYGKPSAVDVLLVRPLPATTMPTRFKRPIEKYKEGVIWVRQGHEVIAAEPKHVPLLYCKDIGIDLDFSAYDGLAGLLPPSSATIKRFVGRLDTIDAIFRWLRHSDEPRNFLYGKGGSGKTTIAYEIAKVIKTAGVKFAIHGGDAIDNVIFVSAKSKSLNTLSNEQADFIGLDFRTEQELYVAILTLGNWTSTDISNFSVDQLRKEIKEFFNLSSSLIVIDDIDTLTTNGLEAGFDFLYGALWRSHKRSKILYTLRNAPSQSLGNAIEVPGLRINGEFEEFVSVCSSQFRVKPPESAFRDIALAAISERRPLVIESIIALRRNCGDYDRAVQLFEQSSGDDVRRYVFQREWDALPADNYGRYILAILSFHNDPLNIADLVALSQYDEGRVIGAVADVREMFLSLNDVGSETTYELGSLTRAFVSEESRKMDRYPILKERIEKYRKNIYPENPILSRLRDKIENLIDQSFRRKDYSRNGDIWQLAFSSDISPKISEDPRFMSLQGYVAATQVPAQLDDARRLFENAFRMKSEPEIRYLRGWFNAERNSGYGLSQCLKISAFVRDGKRYSEEEKLEFLSRSAGVEYMAGKEMLYSDSDRALEFLESALVKHLRCFYLSAGANSIRVSKADEYSRNTAYVYFDFITSASVHDRFFGFLQKIASERNIVLDPIEEPLIRALQFVGGSRGSKTDLNRYRSRIESSFRGVVLPKCWFDSGGAKRVESASVKTRELLKLKADISGGVGRIEA